MPETKERATKKDVPSRAKSIPMHRWRGGSLFGAGAATCFLLMANEHQVPRGPLWGALAMIVAAAGLLDLLGVFARDAATKETTPVTETALSRLPGEPLWMSPQIGAPVALGVLWLGGMIFGAKGLPFVFVAALASLVPAAIRRPGLAAAVIAAGIMLPTLGVYGLWDPWETHYGEVSREILSRDDWISLWWAQEDWFWSKPIFIFWSEALTMGFLGFDFHPDAHPANAEWPLRLPVFLVALFAILAVYAAVQRVYGKRTGLVAAIVLATMPHFFLLAHQAITDMHFVGTMTVAMCLFVLAIAEDPAREVRSYRIGPLVLTARSILLFVLLMIVLPQILYLASRNVTLVEGFRFAWHRDHFMFGSAGNGNVPGNHPTHDENAFLDGPAAQPLAQALWWSLGLAGLVWMILREKRARSLYMFGFYVACALSFMAKGIPGFALPGLIALLWLVATKRWSLLWNGELRVAAGGLALLVVGMPWYVAMYIRHGPAFTDRILVHDHLNRLAAGVHGDNGTIEYFVAQLGWAMFPWVALVPAAITAFLHVGVSKPTLAVSEVVEEKKTAEDTSSSSSSPLSSEGKGEEKKSERGETATPIAGEIRALATQRVVVGSLILLVGLVITFGSYAAAAGGGVFVVTTGAIAAGIVQMVRGLILFGRADALPVALAGGGEMVVGAGEEPSSKELAQTAVASDLKDSITTLVALWFVAGFVLFSAMVTKFHHYIFPIVPPAAILVGILVDRMLGPPANDVPAWRRILGSCVAALAALPIVLGVGAFRGNLRGAIPFEVPVPERGDWVLTHGMGVAGGVGLLLAGAALGAGAYFLLRSREQAEEPAGWQVWGTGLALAAAPVVCAFTGRDLAWVTTTRPAGYERLIDLFVYNYSRPWPDVCDYRPILTGFAIGCTLLFALATVRTLRPVATRALLGAAMLFAVWSLDVYLVDLSPHWSQRDVIATYYRVRTSNTDPLVAWQMNWKGENYYSGNRVNVFVDLDNTKLNTWIRENHGKHAFFMLEHSRLGGFRSLVAPRVVHEITGMRDNNKFLLVQCDL